MLWDAWEKGKVVIWYRLLEGGEHFEEPELKECNFSV